MKLESIIFTTPVVDVCRHFSLAGNGGATVDAFPGAQNSDLFLGGRYSSFANTLDSGSLDVLRPHTLSCQQADAVRNGDSNSFSTK